MNVLFLTNELNYTDGVTTHLYHLLNELKKTSEINFYLACSGGRAIEKFCDAGIKVIVNKNLNHKNRNYKNFLTALKEVIKTVKTKNIDIIHSHNHYAANIAFITSKFTKVKTIQTNHGLIPETGFLRHFKAQYYIAVNEHILDYILSKKIAAKKNVKLIRHGIPFPDNNIQKDIYEIKIICASRLVSEKRVDIFIRASEILRRKHKKKVRFYLCGKGEEENYLKALNEKLNAGVEFLGEVKDLQRILSETHIFTMTTSSESEGFPMTIAEAALSNNLVITSDFKGHKSILKNKEDGFVFNMNDPDDLASKIEFALENPTLTKKIIQKFHIKAMELFDINLMVEKHLSVYRMK